MTIRTSAWPAGTPCWAELSVPDVDTAKTFYESVIGWQWKEPGPDDGGYSMATVNGHEVAAIGPMQAPDQPAQWLLYIASDDVDTTAKAIGDNGGSILLPARDVGAYGRMLVATDPTGATFAVWQAKDHIGAQLVNEPGGITWEDLRSTDATVAQDFYCNVFGFELQTIEMAPGDYRTFHLAGNPAPLGGMGGSLGQQTQSHWVVYFSVPDVDRSVETVIDGGGTVIQPPFDTPFGRMAGVTDPFGAFFQLISPAEA